jgi:hypothetical protein
MWPGFESWNSSLNTAVNFANSERGIAELFHLTTLSVYEDRLCGLVARVPGYRSRGPGFDSRPYQIFWEVVALERGPLSLMSITEELLEWKSSGSGSRKPRLTAVRIVYFCEGVFTAPLHSNGCYSIAACLLAALRICLLSRFLAMGVSSDFNIPAIGRHVTVCKWNVLDTAWTILCGNILFLFYL